VQKLNPIYVWLSCAISFFMLIASNGMVELYKALADTEQYHQDHRDLKYDMQRVSNGIGAVVLLNIVLNVLDKVLNRRSSVGTVHLTFLNYMQSYYRERYLATPIFKWLNGFYEQAEQTEHGAHAVVTASGNADAAGTHQQKVRALLCFLFVSDA
jgi:heme exporter protein D